MSRAQHAIETLSWQSRAARPDAAMAHQARLSAFLAGPGQAAIDKVFSHLSPPGEVWRLDRLEIDLGPLAPEDSFEQWADCLERQLWTQLLRVRQTLPPSARTGLLAWRAAAGTGGARSLSASQHALENFLYYLAHGHLPWSLSPLAGRELSAWLARLAQRTGPRLWTLLQQIYPSDYVLARLSQITPHQGLQALLAVRHRELADSLSMLDEQILAPLQARGRLGAYQVARLQQAWRVAGLRALWGQRAGNLSSDRLRRLLHELGAALSLQLGQGWLSAWRPAQTLRGRRGAQSELTQMLLSGLFCVLGRRPGQPKPPARDSGAAAPRRVVFARAARVDNDSARREVDEPPELSEATLAAWLPGPQRRASPELRAQLQTLLLRRERRWDCARRLSAATRWRLIGALSGRAADSAAASGDSADAANAGARWDESLRQFALAALSGGARPVAGQTAGLSALQAWLLDYTLRQLALGEAAPRDARGWQRLWQRALAEWRAPPAAADPPQPVAVAPVTATTGTTAGKLSRILAFAAEPVARRGWLPRLRIALWLAEPTLCRAWLARTQDAERWTLLHALFPTAAPALETASRALLAAQALLLPQWTGAQRQASHWDFLTAYLLRDGLPPTPDGMARRYALHLCRETLSEHGAQGATLARWLALLDQALNATGAEPVRSISSAALRRAPSVAEQWQASRLPNAARTRAPQPAPPPAIDGHYLNNAGLVLLANYSQRLFGVLGLLDGARFSDAEAQSRAVRCLAYLVDGHDQGSEPEWVLPKLLCGMPLAQPLIGEAGVAPDTRAVLDSLLDAVIAHWSALGRTSPTGLRETFLLREGGLRHEQTSAAAHWRLTVKPGPFDMLLDRLPWSYATIKLPWMTEALYVDWR
ncbi:contractile injection system tape measure protein [Paludibacterium purpuratum]|uniref:Uncharacterized protein n=1 Tax=Paludibacterium purpuratum TaxID=1144873 RepID=A0A4V3DVY5_9NEIS|nr:contractile injection system tape measure protein [Paludibacterium purpuratum]TDR82779.1 hypothetical protein DFP86_101168 [Paludibacterium purpuratum]